MTTITLPQTFDQQISEIAELDFSSELPELAKNLTRAFLSFCCSVYAAKATSNKKQRRENQEFLGWTSTTANPYAKVGEWLTSVPTQHLEMLDVKTIMALCAEKYLPVIERLESEALSVAEIREEMAAINLSLKKEKEPPKVLEWVQDNEGNATLIARLDPDTGRELERKQKHSGLPLALFLRELLRAVPEPHEEVKSVVEVEVEKEEPSVKLNPTIPAPFELQFDGVFGTSTAHITPLEIRPDKRLQVKVQYFFADGSKATKNGPVKDIEELRTVLQQEIDRAQAQALLDPARRYRVQQLGEDEPVWIEDCWLKAIPNPPRDNWFIFQTPTGETIKVAGESEFQIV